MEPLKPMKPMEPMGDGDRWWPDGLGAPGASGAGGGLRYAVFPDARRLAVERDGTVEVYDTGGRRVSGVSQGDSGPVLSLEGGGTAALGDLERAG